MSIAVIRWKESRQMVDIMADSVNASQPVVQDAAGKTRRQNTLKQGHRDTMKLMVKLYAQQVDKLAWVKEGTEIPPFRCNSQGLAKELGVSPRTVRNHLQRLLDTHMLVGKEFRGWQSDFHVWINPKILHFGIKISPATVEKLQKQNSPWFPFFADQRKNFPPICNRTQQSNNKDKASLRDSAEEGNTHSARQKFEQKVKQKQALRAARIEKKDPEAARAAQIRSYSRSLWLFAQAWLYSHYRTWYPGVEEKVLSHLDAYFTAQTGAGLQKQATELSIRLRLVKDYLARNPSRFVLPPTQYFDRAIGHGFAGTRDWYVAHMRKAEGRLRDALSNEERRAERILQTKVAAWFRYTTIPPGQRKQQPWELVRDHNRSLEKLNNPEILRRYHQEIGMDLPNRPAA